MSTKKNKKTPAPLPDRHALYEAAVQDAETEVHFIRRIYRQRCGHLPQRLREDFSATALLASEWVVRARGGEAWAVDLDPEPLDWARTHRMSHLGAPARRLHLVEGDARTARTPPVDVIAALNFSYCLFKEREELLGYFRSARKRLSPDGLFLVDVFGGTESQEVKKDHRQVPATRLPDGTKVPGFRYTWHQAKFNPVTHDILCHIHFRFKDHTRIKRAFTYDWRLWTIPEIRDLAAEAGFTGSDVYIHSFDEDGDSDEIYRRRTRYDNTLGWVAYVAAWR